MTRADLTENELILVDEVLYTCAKLECTLGIDSNNFERTDVRLKKEKEYEKIRIIKPEFHKSIKGNP